MKLFYGILAIILIVWNIALTSQVIRNIELETINFESQLKTTMLFGKIINQLKDQNQWLMNLDKVLYQAAIKLEMLNPVPNNKTQEEYSD